jgi:uncharacterized membrane protein
VPYEEFRKLLEHQNHRAGLSDLWHALVVWWIWQLGCFHGWRALLLNLVSLLTLVLWIVLMLKAFQGMHFKLPLAGDIAESLAGRAI